ncbi:MFS transporter [Micromonospora sp. NPDC048947]|uniref:MFS transporter n=1 Tax=Micromonospora sp. NPDC048947 TaxID=3154826 RepID=UPI0033E58409
MNKESSTGVQAYRALLGERDMRRLAVAALVARLTMSMWSVVLFLLVADRRDESSAALALAAYTVGQALTAPARGRWIDRRGVQPVLLVTTSLYILMVAVLVAVIEGSSMLVIAGVAVLSGAFMPPVAATIRGLWIALTLPGKGRHTAMALDAVLLEVAFVVGPAAAGLLATWTDPAVAVLPVIALLVLSAVLVIRSEPAEQVLASRSKGGWGPVASSPFRTTLLLALVPSLVSAAVEVLLLTISHSGGYEWAGGLLLAGMAVGSLVGGLVFGAYGSGRTPQSWLPIMLLLTAGGIVMLLLGQAAPWSFIVVAPLVGATTAPCLATVFSLSAATTPPGQRTEAQSWVNTSLALGFAMGALVVAPFADQVDVAVVLLVVIAAVGALAARLVGPSLARHAGPE